MRESDYQRHCIQTLLEQGWFVLRVNSSYMQNTAEFGVWSYTYYPEIKPSRSEVNDKHKGCPDIIAFKGNKFMMLEIKSKDGRLRKTQEKFQSAAKRHANINVYVVTEGLTDLQQIINENESCEHQ